MESSEARNKIIIIMAAVALVMIVGGAIFHRSIVALEFAIGVILTTALNAVKLFMMERTSERIMDIEDEKSGKNFASIQYLLRFILTGAVLVAAAFVPFIDIMGAIFGIFTMPVAIHVWRITGFSK